MTKTIFFMALLALAGTTPAFARHHHAADADASPTPDSSEDSEPRTGPNGTPIVRAESVVVMDARTGQILYEKNADERRPVASTQKLMTALIVAGDGNLNDPVRVDESDTWCEPVKLNIQPGEVYRRGDLLQVMLVHSVNDVARCLARDNAGSVEAFADKMNRKAADMGMSNTHFVNPNGLPAPENYSTARDMSKVAFADYHNPLIRSIVCQRQVYFRYADGRVREFDNTNKVLLHYAECNGMKTGYTEAAGHCLISSASDGRREIISVAMGDNESIWKDSYALLQWGLGGGGSSARIGANN